MWGYYWAENESSFLEYNDVCSDRPLLEFIGTYSLISQRLAGNTLSYSLLITYKTIRLHIRDNSNVQIIYFYNIFPPTMQLIIVSFPSHNMFRPYTAIIMCL
jgi:hypothetical protein